MGQNDMFESKFLKMKNKMIDKGRENYEVFHRWWLLVGEVGVDDVDGDYFIFLFNYFVLNKCKDKIVF